MPRTLSDEDLLAIDGLIARRLQARVEAPLPHKLTMAEFAWCVERGVQSVRERRRRDRHFRAHCEGKKRIKIHPAALALYGVDSGLAAARLRQFPRTSTAQSADKAAPLPA